jgi:hypothetical protein
MKKFLMNPWTIKIGGTIIATFIITFINSKIKNVNLITSFVPLFFIIFKFYYIYFRY